MIDSQNELASCRSRADELMHQYEKAEKKIEQFWADEPNQGLSWQHYSNLMYFYIKGAWH